MYVYFSVSVSVCMYIHEGLLKNSSSSGYHKGADWKSYLSKPFTGSRKTEGALQ